MRQLRANAARSLAGAWHQAATTLADALSSTEPAPGGGAAAAVAGAMGCGLGMMACGISLKSKKLDASRRPGLEAAAERFKSLKNEFLSLAREDASAFEGFMAAMGLPKDDPARPAKMQAALLAAAEAPLRTARASAEACRLSREARPLCVGTVSSDMHSSLHLLAAAARCAAENVRINLQTLKDQARASELEADLAALLAVFEEERGPRG